MECISIGSLPYKTPDEALKIVQKYFNKFPFWPQLTNVCENEDMVFQFLEGMPSFFIDENELNEFRKEFDEICQTLNPELLKKYAITPKCSACFEPFIDLLNSNHVKYAKGQITGPFTLSINLKKNGTPAIFDTKAREIISKTLILKALWQIQEIKSTQTIPVIFIDEPSIPQLKFKEYSQLHQDEIFKMLKTTVKIINKSGAISAIHCCDEADWTRLIDTGINLISFDVFTYPQNLNNHYKKIKTFLQNGGKIVWGIVPTNEKTDFESINIPILTKIFEKAVNDLTKRGINEKLIIGNSFISPSCGTGSLSEEITEKILELTINLSDSLKERYNDN